MFFRWFLELCCVSNLSLPLTKYFLCDVSDFYLFISMISKTKFWICIICSWSIPFYWGLLTCKWVTVHEDTTHVRGSYWKQKMKWQWEFIWVLTELEHMLLSLWPQNCNTSFLKMMIGLILSIWVPIMIYARVLQSYALYP